MPVFQMPPISPAPVRRYRVSWKRIVRYALSKISVMPGVQGLVGLCAVGPGWLKTPLYQKIISELSRSEMPLIETNLGLNSALRVLIPRNKTDLLYGRPSNNLSERSAVELVDILVLKSRAFIDIGANEGLFTFSVASRLGRKASRNIHAFEPDPDLYSRLLDNVRRNKLNINVNQLAISASPGRATFNKNLSCDSSGSLTREFLQKHETVEIEVNTGTLSDYLVAKDLSATCVKVDTEGAGAFVWNGALSAADRIDWFIAEIIGPEVAARLPERIIAEAGWNAYYLRDFDLIPSKCLSSELLNDIRYL